MRSVFKTTVAAAALVLTAGLAAGSAKAETITLHGASQFDEDHAFTKTLRKFEELVPACYHGEPIKFESASQLRTRPGEGLLRLHEPGHLGRLRRSSRRRTCRPSRKKAPLMDMPFLFRDLDHWNKVLDADALAADRRRRPEEGRRAADRLCRRRHAQPDRQQAGHATWTSSRACRCG